MAPLVVLQVVLQVVLLAVLQVVLLAEHQVALMAEHRVVLLAEHRVVLLVVHPQAVYLAVHKASLGLVGMVIRKVQRSPCKIQGSLTLTMIQKKSSRMNRKHAQALRTTAHGMNLIHLQPVMVSVAAHFNVVTVPTIKKKILKAHGGVQVHGGLAVGRKI